MKPRRRRIRLAVAPLLLAALAVGAAACSSVRPAALEVNGHEYSESSVNDELEAIADNPGLGEQATRSNGTLNSQLTAAWLQTLVEEQVVNRELERRDLRVTAADRAGAGGGGELPRRPGGARRLPEVAAGQGGRPLRRP